MKKILPLFMLVSLTALSSLASAQALPSGPAARLGQPIVRSFAWADVASRQGLINLSPSGFTSLQFEDEIEALFIRNSAAVECQNCPVDPSDQARGRRLPPEGGNIIFVTSRQVGDSDIIVQVKGQQLFFKVSIQKANPSQVSYVVRSPRTQSPVASRPTPSDNTAVNQALSDRQNLPVGLQQMVAVGNGRVVVTLRNGGSTPLTLDPSKLTLKSLTNQSVEASVQVVSPQDYDGTLGAGEVLNLVLIPKGSPSRALALEWPLSDGQASFVLKRFLGVVLSGVAPGAIQAEPVPEAGR